VHILRYKINTHKKHMPSKLAMPIMAETNPI
jgi:hypothetical protein